MQVQQTSSQETVKQKDLYPSKLLGNGNRTFKRKVLDPSTVGTVPVYCLFPSLLEHL